MKISKNECAQAFDGWKKKKTGVSFVNKTSTNDLWVNRNEDFDGTRRSESLEFFMIFNRSVKSRCIVANRLSIFKHSSPLNIIMKFYRKRKKMKFKTFVKQEKKQKFRGTRRKEVNEQQHQQTRRKESKRNRNRSIPQTILLSYTQTYVSLLALVNLQWTKSKRRRRIYHLTMAERKINK